MAGEKTEERKGERELLLEKYGGQFRSYAENRVNVDPTLKVLRGNVRKLPGDVFSALERLTLENQYDRLAIELDPLKKLQQLSGIEQAIRTHYAAVIGIEVRGDNYGDEKDRRKMIEEGMKVLETMADYKREEE